RTAPLAAWWTARVYQVASACRDDARSICAPSVSSALVTASMTSSEGTNAATSAPTRLAAARPPSDHNTHAHSALAVAAEANNTARRSQKLDAGASSLALLGGRTPHHNALIVPSPRARCVACRGVRAQPVPVALVGECSIPLV